jgi:Alginate lyase
MTLRTRASLPYSLAIVGICACAPAVGGSPAGMGTGAGGGGNGPGGGMGGRGGAIGTAGTGGAPGNGGTSGSTGNGTGMGGAASGGAFGGEDAAASDGGATSGLIHPGGFLTQSEMKHIRTNVAAGQDPWASAWTALKNSDAGPTYQPTVTATVTDAYALQNQGHAAYVLAVKWVASGDVAYATASKRILDAWVNTVTSLMGTTLRTGVGASQFANAAEIMAYGFNGTAGWPPAQITKAKSWFGDVVWPVIGQADAQRSSNWGTSAMAGCMATAIFTDDRARFDYTVDAYKNGFTDAPDGCSGATQYICEASGQPAEAGRDQGHAQGGVGHLVEVALMAWNQGMNLVTFTDNRLVAGMEYLAKYNLGGDVPYDPNFPDPCNVYLNWATISATGRGSFSPIYEMANKLFDVAAIPHPFTTQVVNSPGYQPEPTNSDHPGSGTLIER